MSSVVISGNTSGTITLDAPAVAGTTTLTLPATSGTVLTTASTGVVTQAMLSTNVAGNGPAFSAYNSNQAIGNNSFVKISNSNEVYDTNSNYDPTTNYRFTPTIAGYYIINGSVALAASSGFCTVAIFKNGSLAFAGGQAALLSGYTIVNVSSMVYFNGTTDYVELYCLQNSGLTLNTISGGAGYNIFNGALVRSA
jgi:hypothetical protein